MFMYQLLVVMLLTFKTCKVSLIFTFIFTINNKIVIVLVVGGCHGVYRFHGKDMATHSHRLNGIVFPLFCYSGSFH